MKVKQVLAVLATMDENFEVAVEQIFTHEGRSIELRSIELIGNCVVFKDHYVRVSTHNAFISFDGVVFEVPTVPERMLPNAARNPICG
jgi:hypothetical protein